MSMLPSPPSYAKNPLAADAAQWSRPMFERQLDRLDRLAEFGMEVVEGLARQVRAEPGAETVQVAHGDIALAYARAARAVRQCIALQSKLISDRLVFEQDVARGVSHTAFLADQAARRAGRPQSREDAELQAVERLSAIASERAEDLSDAPLNRPFEDIVADIRRDLGMAEEWDARPPPLAGEVARRDGGGVPVQTASTALLKRGGISTPPPPLRGTPPPQAGEDASP
jgi:hypothetical protein